MRAAQYYGSSDNSDGDNSDGTTEPCIDLMLLNYVCIQMRSMNSNNYYDYGQSSNQQP
jgi:hypothetical protein